MIRTEYLNENTFLYWGRRNPFLKMMGNVRNSANTAKEKGQKYGRKEPWEIDIDAEYLEWLFSEQMGCCPYYEQLGIIKKLDLNLLYETFNFLTPSVDRIDPDFGYIKGNVVITLRGINHMKQKIPFDNFMIQLAKFENKKIIKKSKNIINKLFNPNISNNMKPIDLMRAFVDAGDLTYAMKVLKLSDEVPSKSKHTKTKSSLGEKRKARRKYLSDRLKPFDDSKNLVSVTEYYNWNSPDNIYARDDNFINDVSSSLYRSPNGTKTQLYVDIDSVA
jgi:hypothetical protein